MTVFEVLLALSMLVNSAFSEWKSASNFIKHHNEALQGHVIQTIPTNRIDCSMKCGETMGCRSINIYKDGSGNDMCDLNKSARSNSPGFMVSRDGYQHWELTSRNGCNTEECLGSPSIGWKTFSSSKFKVFNDRVTWGEARKRCRDVGADLVSIHSQQEQDFISAQLLPNVTRGTVPDAKLIMFWKLNGSDVMLSLKGSASYETVDGYQALYLDGNSANYATTPPMDLTTRGFTLGAWVKLVTPLSDGLVYGDWSSPFKFALNIDKEGKVHFKIWFASMNSTILTSNGKVEPGVWNHIMATWVKTKQTLKIFLNATLDIERVLNVAEIAFMSTSHDHDIGLNRNSSSVLHAYMRDLLVSGYSIVTKARATYQMNRVDKQDSVWTGLNDLEIENTFRYSDGSPMTYQNWGDKYPAGKGKFSNCVQIPLAGGPGYQWIDGSCGLELPYICRKELN